MRVPLNTQGLEGELPLDQEAVDCYNDTLTACLKIHSAFHSTSNYAPDPRF
jgi:hypothetical protein